VVRGPDPPPGAPGPQERRGSYKCPQSRSGADSTESHRLRCPRRAFRSCPSPLAPGTWLPPAVPELAAPSRVPEHLLPGSFGCSALLLVPVPRDLPGWVARLQGLRLPVRVASWACPRRDEVDLFFFFAQAPSESLCFVSPSPASLHPLRKSRSSQSSV
jgi:hypothetical protein